jgi:plasmid maintenance system antidote protein VapI
MSKIVNIKNVDPNNLQIQNYNSEDESLINSTVKDITFSPSEDYLEYFILDLNKNILFSNVTGYPYYKIQDNDILIDPQKDLETQDFNEGQYYTIYNFLKKKISSSPNHVLFIQDISSDRTELRLNTNQISNLDITSLTTQFAIDIDNALGSYQDFYLNFGNNQLLIAVNIALDNSNVNDPTVLIKLYEPLPENFTFQSQCWIVEQIAESIAYNIELITVFEFIEQLNFIKGPNLNLDIQNQINNTTSYQNYNSLSQNSSIAGSGSLSSQINSLLIEKGIEINIDFSDYSEFVHFSSAQARLENFYYKLSLIEQYTINSSLSQTTSSSLYTTSSQIIWDNKIDEIITNFDGYEYYLYFSSESYSWPKTNSSPPFINYNTTTSIAIDWFTTQSISSSFFDAENVNALVNTIPLYLKEDQSNEQYNLFINMIGQNFDNVWIYSKDITNKFNADNRLNYGISKDIVAQAIRDLGVKLYQNNFSSTDVYSSLIGLTLSGSTFNIPYVTSSLPTPTGFEYINTFITSSDPNSLEPLDDVNKEIYKRIYHNLPYLLKKKGTPEGLRTLINIYGVPDTILRINEFGGSDSSTWDNFQNQFNYEFFTTESAYVRIPRSSIGVTHLTGSYEFRFKTLGIPSSSAYNQTLFNIRDSSFQNKFGVVLEYTGSGFTSSSYSGSIIDPYYQYGTLKLISGSVTFDSASLYLPFFDGGWWSVLINNVGVGSTFYSKNNIYDGEDGNNIGFQSSSSLDLPLTVSPNPINIYLSFVSNTTMGGTDYTPFSGSFQEFRYYNIPLSESQFNDYVMNPLSIEGNSINNTQTSLKNLKFRAPLGSMLDNDSSITTRTSIHPSITSYPPTASFSVGSSYYLSGSFSFLPNYEITYQNQSNSGVKNAVTNKIRIIDEILPIGDTLSPYISIQQINQLSGSFTKDINYVEVGFSPQDEINDDIISQLGNFNIGDYIGDPRQASSSLNYYPDFDKIRDKYFSKYTQNYNLWDYIRLIKFYDNSLFKMIKDFTPARTGLATGIIIKQTLLERKKYPLPQATTNSEITFVGSPTTKTFNIPY